MTEPEDLLLLAKALPGQVLPGSHGRRYPLRELLGEGGQGWVFRATWNGSVDVVVKVLRPDAATTEALARFQREASVLQRISQQSSPNPHVVRFYDHAYATVEVAAARRSWQLPFTVLELVDGITLESALLVAQPLGLELARVRRILRHVVFALRDVHAQNVVHRDLKPSNILLTGQGPREIAKVTDFGLAKLLDPGMHRTNTLAGATVGYAPPEQFEPGNARVGRATDIFSLAAIFYELVTGVAAFPFHPQAHPAFVMARILADARPALARVEKQLPAELRSRPDIVAAVDVELGRALSPRPEDRHATIDAFYSGIEGALRGLGSSPSITVPATDGVIVRGSASPANPVSVRVGRERTLSAGEEATVAMDATPSEPPPKRPDSSAGSSSRIRADGGIPWRTVAAPLAPHSFVGIAAAPLGDAAIGVGTHGTARWNGRAWDRLEVPPSFDPRASRAAAWLGGTVFLAGASPQVVALAPDKSLGLWRFEAPGLTFHGASADAYGLLLAGERRTIDGSVGVLAEIPLGPRAGRPLHVLDVPGSRALRAAVRLGPGVLGCGDQGTLAYVADNIPLRVVHACEAPLHAVLPFQDGTAVAVGSGGFVFRVTQRLEFAIQSMQTTKDLHALTRGPDGSEWCGGAEQRVLRHGPSGWSREGALPGSGTILALHVGPSRVLAFADDGSVTEGQYR